MNKKSDMNNHNLDIRHPLLIIGIGGAGTRLATDSSKLLNCQCLLISNDKKDLKEDYPSIYIDTETWINPSNHRLRSFVQNFQDQIKSAIVSFRTVIIMANLAGKAGMAMAPAICKIARENSTPSNVLLSLVIMPFCFENDRLFQSGISLKRVRDLSDATVVVDNDAFLQNSPELSPDECYKITNGAMYEVISSIYDQAINPQMNLLCTGKADCDSTVELLLKDSISMLSQDADADSVKRAILYIMRGEKVPLGTLNSLINNLHAIFKHPGSTEVSLAMVGSNKIAVHLMAAVEEKTRFDEYDPLGEIIPKENTLDWDELDSSPEIDIKIPNLE